MKAFIKTEALNEKLPLKRYHLSVAAANIFNSIIKIFFLV